MTSLALSAGLLALSLLSGCSTAAQDPSPDADSSTPIASVPSTSTSTSTSVPGAGASASEDGTGQPSGAPAGQSGQSGQSGQPSTTAGGAEMPPATGSATLPAQPPRRAPASSAPLASLPLPRTASAVGRLVEGFPALARPVPGSVVVASSVSSDGQRLQLALDASTDRPAGRVMRGFRARLAQYGMREQQVASVAGSEAAAFRRGGSSLVVTVAREGTRTTYTVSGVLHAGGS